MKSGKQWLFLGAGLCLLVAVPSSAQQRHKQPLLSAVDRRLLASAKHTQFLHLYGSGPLWENDAKPSGITVAQGLEVHSPRLIRALLQNFRCTDQAADWDGKTDRGGYIQVDFMAPHDTFLDNIEYIHQGKGAYELKDRANGQIVSLRPGYGAKFEKFVRGLAARARRHDPAVQIWDIDAS